MATRMLQRRGTAAEWAAANPVLGDGEVGVERNTGVVKIGDGTTAWASLTNVYRRFVDAVAKAGDTMTGDLTILKNDPALLLQESPTDRIRLISDAGTQYIQVDDELRVTEPYGAAFKNLRAGEIYDSGTRVYSPSNPQPASNPFAVVDAVGDLLVGSANDAVARLAKGPNGSVLTVSSGGVVVWQTPVDASTKVSKTGDAMTGILQLDRDSSGTSWGSASLEVQDTNRPRIAFHQPGSVASQIGQEDNAETIRTYDNAGTGYADFRARDIYDNNNRVYSASNPPPVAGMSVLGGWSVGIPTWATATGNNSWQDLNGSVTFVAPSNGRVNIILSCGGGYQTGDQTALKVGFRVTALHSTGNDARSLMLGYIQAHGSALYSLTGLTPEGTYTIIPTAFCTGYMSVGTNVSGPQGFSIGVEG